MLWWNKLKGSCEIRIWRNHTSQTEDYQYQATERGIG